MQKPKFLLYSGTLLLAATLTFFAACRKNNDDKNTTTTQEDTGYASDQAMSEKIFDDAQTMADKGNSTTGSGAFKTTACGTVAHSSGTFTIDFGSSNCLCTDGRYRRGKIIVTYSGAYSDSGSTHTITFDNYYQNDNKVEGTKTVTNMGANSLGQPFFNVNVNGTITKADGSVISVSYNRVRTWTAGYTTLLNWTDDVYQITGGGTITRSSGVIDVSITTPLIVSLDCRYIEAGTITYTLPSGLTRTLNYGNTPVCDNLATLTLPSGATYTVSLP